MNENNDDGGSKIALSHDKDAFYMYIDQWRRQRGADGARAPPFCVSSTPNQLESP